MASIPFGPKEERSIACPSRRRNLKQNWDLDSLLPPPAGEAFAKIVETYRCDLQALAERSDRLPAVSRSAADAATWEHSCATSSRLEMQAADLSAFIGANAAADAANKLYRQFEAACRRWIRCSERISTNLEFALRDARPADFRRAGRDRPDALKKCFFLTQRRKNGAPPLPRGEELLAADLAVTAFHAWGRLYDRLSGELRIKVMERGEVVEKSPGQIRFDSPNDPSGRTISTPPTKPGSRSPIVAPMHSTTLPVPG